MALLALAAGFAVVIGGILVLRLHAFLALFAGAIVVAAVTPADALAASVGSENSAAAASLAASSAMDRVVDGFAVTAGKIGILIAMAAIVGVCLLESGAAERIVFTTQSALGDRWTAAALVVASFILAVPVFFDTVFFLMLPIAQSLAVRRGGDYLKFVLAIVVGGSLAHSLIPPTPGPLAVASELDVSLPAMMLGGLAVGVPGVLAGYGFLVVMNRRRPVAAPAAVIGEAGRSESAGQTAAVSSPSIGWSLVPIVLPVVCLAAGTIWPGPVGHPNLADRIVAWIGDRNVALSLAAAASLGLLATRPGVSRGATQRAVGRALADGGTVILITCAGGALGQVIRQTNIAATIAASAPAAATGSGLLMTAFGLTAVVRVAQGSATVAMLTTVGIVAPLATATPLPYHPVYLALAIGCGSKPLPWMNDSGFWTISRMAGLTESQTLQTFTPLLTIMGVVAMAMTWLGSLVLPLV